ncbi:MAG: hypothetical protein KDC31_11355 [Saprospiraceae bacterium]|jgi:YegS/Rv2252/BmrU family lipid kinase|nr:hypothetical protein [Saprospiraceae bacterium]MBX7179383.1 hypothetical protein [Saprospiraceae bacterium]MCB0591881.1 hypothetical protein [Saprospiraceae bacterium]MCO5282922.1 hypothetical protein [Saprospiraceae bacterium]MCO6469612.1 hypothetical protein [Saprospiraceae bacterium]
MRNIHFIVNPISGKGRQTKELNEDFLKSMFPSDQFSITMSIIPHKGATGILTEQAIAAGAETIVACGGDGTINEVARHLVHTDIRLGIIPRGSGNGLASHLAIPKNLLSCLNIIRTGNTTKIDTALAGNFRFFSNCGFGFPTELIRQYELIPQRRLSGYIKAGLSSIHAIKDSAMLKITCNGKIMNARHLFVSNSNKMGYGMTLAPGASLKDGLFNVQVIGCETLISFGIYGLMVLMGKGDKKKEVTDMLATGVEVEGFKPLQAQIDGEFHQLNEQKIQIINEPASLNVLIANTSNIP